MDAFSVLLMEGKAVYPIESLFNFRSFFGKQISEGTYISYFLNEIEHRVVDSGVRESTKIQNPSRREISR
jgi:hypothetical protein